MVDAIYSNEDEHLFLECAGELRINILRRMKRGKEPPKQKCYRDKGSVTHPRKNTLS